MVFFVYRLYDSAYQSKLKLVLSSQAGPDLLATIICVRLSVG